MTFGQTIAAAREVAGLSQCDLATWIIREDGRSITPEYLDDLECDRRRPPSIFLVEQFGGVLDVPRGLLVFLAGMALLDSPFGAGPEQRQWFGAA